MRKETTSTGVNWLTPRKGDSIDPPINGCPSKAGGLQCSGCITGTLSPRELASVHTKRRGTAFHFTLSLFIKAEAASIVAW